jgi:hypothetical protein
MINLRPAYLHRVFDALSQFLNVLVLNGDANESISGRAHRLEWTLVESIIDKAFFWEHAHCYWAYMNDLERARQLIKGV